ncbi:MAG: HNH endonuclease [Desulfobacterales bacterium]|nr:HNH endonuclease [Desulfobacterales bacterium]MBI5894633.1 HNH endonuclease [Desulfobacterales bacterium]
MARNDRITPFAFDLESSDIAAQKHKARELRASQWWKRRCAKGSCHWCGQAVAPRELTMDHIVPISRGGQTAKNNVVPACKQCNNKKKQLLPMEWEHYVQSLRSHDEGEVNEPGP